MVKIAEEFQNSFSFLPPRTPNVGHHAPPNSTAALPTPPPTVSSQCADNISYEIPFNFSADIFCELISEYRQYQVLDPRTRALVVVGYATLIAMGIVSNVLVCCVVVRQTTHKTSQLGGKSRNLYILNLALADLALCCISMPLSLHNLLHFHWTLGAFLCKIGPVVQTTNILVSAGTVTAIAIDRYNTIVRSPRVRGQPQSDGHEVAAGIAIIWLLSLLLTSPLFFYTHVESVEFSNVFLYDRCIEIWPSDTVKLIFNSGLTSVHFFIPVIILSTIHFKISAFLKRHLKPFQELRPKIEIHSPIDIHHDKCNNNSGDDNDAEKRPLQKEFLNIKRKSSICSDNSQRSDSSRKYSDCSDSKRFSTPDISPRKRSYFLSSFRENSDFSFSFSKLSRESSKKGSKSVRKELSRNRRTTLLLSCIASVYAVSWLPYHVYNVVTNVYPQIATPAILYKAFAAVHLLAMTSVCVNPFLYGWLNTNFRREFVSIYASISNGFSKLCKESSKIINKNAYNCNDVDVIYKDCDGELRMKNKLSLLPPHKQDCVMVAIFTDSRASPTPACNV